MFVACGVWGNQEEELCPRHWISNNGGSPAGISSGNHMSMDMVGGDLPEGHMSLSPPWLSFISLGASHRVQECGTLVGEDLGTASSKRVVVLGCCKPGSASGWVKGQGRVVGPVRARGIKIRPSSVTKPPLPLDGSWG